MKIKAANGKTYTIPQNPVWRKGPPPDVGWWPASFDGIFVDVLRFWDGQHWSQYCRPLENERSAEINAGKKIYSGKSIQWTDRWWLDQNQQ